jgi:metallo-beta-lactamase class B
VRVCSAAIAATMLVPALVVGQSSADSARRARECPSCAEWNVPQKPLRVFGNTFYVGTHGLGSVLVTSPRGHVLIDGALPESAPLILTNIRALGFRVEDVKVILNSHAHYDHAGGIAALQAASGAVVRASAWSAAVIQRGASDDRDPQFGLALPYPGATSVREIADGDVVRIGDLALTARFTGGHTPGGTTWTWRSCEGDRCLDIVYADSQTPVSTDGFFYTRSTTYATGIADFEHAESTLDGLACDILITPHPGASRFWERVAARDSGNAQALVDRDACRSYAAAARRQLAERITKENGAKK